MPDTSLTRLFDALSGMALGLWAGLFIVILAGVVWVLRTERRQFVRQGKTRGWLWMRVLAVPILALVAAAVVLPARAVSGAEALGVFYIALFTLAPLLWFGLHILAGRMQSPRFTRSESMGLAISGLGILIVPPLLVSMAQGPISIIARASKFLKRDHLNSEYGFPLSSMPSGKMRRSIGMPRLAALCSSSVCKSSSRLINSR